MSAAKRSTATTERALRIAVIGGGIAGLTAALAFAQRGFEVRLHEQAEALTETGAGIQITPNGMKVLDALGVGADLRRAGVGAHGLNVTSSVSGNTLASIDFPASDYLFLLWPDLIAVLAARVRSAGVSVQLNTRTRAEEIDADLVIAADGVQSGHRLALGNPGARFSGMVAWRATFEGDAAPRALLWTGPGCHVVSYPVRRGLVNLVAVSEVSGWEGAGWSHPAAVDEMQSHYAFAEPVLAGLLSQPKHVTKWALRQAPVASRWQDTRVVLIGDAAHPTLPFLAQGANMAIEDAGVLARMVANDGKAALPRFETVRKVRTTRIVATAATNARIYHARGPARLAVEAAMRLMPQSRLQHRYDWIYDFAFAAD